MWSHAVTAARRVRPAVQVLGPSTSSFSLDFLRTFLSAANASNTMPNVLSWHEFSADGADIPSVVVPHARVAVPSLLLAIVAVRGNVAAARQLLQEFGALEPSAAHPSGTQISINEMVPMGSNFDPATHIFYFANLERVRCQHTAEALAFLRSPQQ